MQNLLKAEPSELLLQRAYRWEKEIGSVVYMTQPMGGGVIREYTWGRTLDEVRRMARHLQSYGFPKGSAIAILSKNCANFIMSDLAIWMAGYVSVAIYPTVNAKTLRYVLEHSEAKLVFVGKLDNFEELKKGISEGLPCIAYPLSPKSSYPTWDDIIAKSEPLEGSPTRGVDDPAIITYTSGSTGQPKGVVHSFSNLSMAIKGLNALIKLGHDDRVISYLPLAHVFERAAIEAISLLVGCQIFFADSLETFVADIQRARPTLFHSVPRLWLKFQHGVYAKMPEQKLRRLFRIPIVSGIIKRQILKGLGLDKTRMAVSGSAPIPPELIQWYRDLGLELLEGYGMSENFCYSHFSMPGKSRVGYVGNNQLGVETKLSEEGEILVRSPANMIGYYKDPQLTKEAFTEDRFLKTGDRGEIDPQGRLRITGRIKELFKTSKGKYVAPTPIENLLNANPSIEMSCVGGNAQPQPYALVMLSETLRRRLKKDSSPALIDEITATLTELRKSVNKELEEHEHLQFLVVIKDEWQIENGFLTPTLKLKRDVVEKHYAAQVDGWYAAGKPVIVET
jgi:long-subunit acyl-CoA synthetase (AMP-forming)